MNPPIIKYVYRDCAPIDPSDSPEKQWADGQAWIKAGNPPTPFEVSDDYFTEDDLKHTSVEENLDMLDEFTDDSADASYHETTDFESIAASTASRAIVNSPRRNHSTLGEIVKSAKAKRRVSVFRDAAFMQHLQALLEKSEAGSLDATSVSRLSLLTHPLDSSIFDRASKHEPWWTRLNAGEPLPKPARQFRTPAEWRDVSDTLHVHYLRLALKTLGPVHDCTLRLSDSVEAQVRSEPNALGWLTARITKRLRDILGRSIQFYAVLEQDELGRLHLHGELTLGPDNGAFVPFEVAEVRRALRLAGGEWSKNRQFQAKVRSDPDAGWAGYISKDAHLYGSIVRPYLKLVRSRYAPSFDGGQFTATALLQKVAAKVYGEHRDLVVSPNGK